MHLHGARNLPPSVWREIAAALNQQYSTIYSCRAVREYWHKYVHLQVVRGRWSEFEDEAIKHWVSENGEQCWLGLAQWLTENTGNARVAAQARCRYCNALKPQLYPDSPLTPVEEAGEKEEKRGKLTFPEESLLKSLVKTEKKHIEKMKQYEQERCSRNLERYREVGLRINLLQVYDQLQKNLERCDIIHWDMIAARFPNRTPYFLSSYYHRVLANRTKKQ
jgi:hypothetical protein